MAFVAMVTACAVDEGKTIIRDSMNLFDDPHHSTVVCTAGRLHLGLVQFHFLASMK